MSEDLLNYLGFRHSLPASEHNQTMGRVGQMSRKTPSDLPYATLSQNIFTFSIDRGTVRGDT
jgi:hypothetical protein